jgi:hypothetical protein
MFRGKDRGSTEEVLGILVELVELVELEIL